MGPPGPPGEAQAYPSELMGAGKPLLLSGRRKRSVTDHPPVINLPDLEADFETVVIDISENRLSLKEGVHLFVDKMWNHIVKVSHKSRIEYFYLFNHVPYFTINATDKIVRHMITKQTFIIQHVNNPELKWPH